MATLDSSQKLKKELGLFDVFSVSTGAMFSSGFFLLPGLAAYMAGPAVILAYFLAGIIILPSMFSAAELSTALPRAGGAYYFLDRSLGPMFGTIGGLGTYFALTLKTAFALIGIGAYGSLVFDMPVKPVAIALTGVFVVLNIMGAKETMKLQRALVTILLAVLAVFTLAGMVFVLFQQEGAVTRSRLEPFMPHGVGGLFATVGFVFVSYAGLTKVASVAEEVKNPERNIPLGMMLSLAVTSLIYVFGAFIMISVLEATPEVLYNKERPVPVALASEKVLGWLMPISLYLIVASALAAFISTGNAGLMSASRYPLAMARDRLLPAGFAKLSGKKGTPVNAILATGVIMVFFILALDAEGIAKLASAFQLFIFMLLNFAVIVMRESRIESYDPGYRSPLYPWMQYFGIITSLVLIVYMGWMAIAFTAGIVAVCILWYRKYAHGKVERDGAIFHWFGRLGTKQYDGLDREFREIMKEKGLREKDPFDSIVANSIVLDFPNPIPLDAVFRQAAEQLARRLPETADEIYEKFTQGTLTGETPVSRGVALPHFRSKGIDHAEMVLVRSREALLFPGDDSSTAEIETEVPVHAVFLLISPESDPKQHLRILAQIAGRVEEDDFAERWHLASDDGELREILMREDHFFIVEVTPGTLAGELQGKRLCDLGLPPDTLVAMIRRGRSVVVPRGDTVLQKGDRLTFIGEPKGLRETKLKYRS